MGHKPSDYCHDNKVKHLLEDAVGKVGLIAVSELSDFTSLSCFRFHTTLLKNCVTGCGLTFPKVSKNLWLR